MISDSEGEAAITIRKNGLASTSLFNQKKGDLIGVRGPYGNSFSINHSYKRQCLIGGGTGLVPLIRFLKLTTNLETRSIIIIGAKSKKELFFVDTISKIMKSKDYDLLISTEDGSAGVKGYPTDILNSLLNKEPQFEIVFTCGPELMMKKVYDLLDDKDIQLEASIERYMKCGVGICSSCSINNKLVCIDGTVFSKKQLSMLPEFGKKYRNKAGILTNY